MTPNPSQRFGGTIRKLRKILWTLWYITHVKARIWIISFLSLLYWFCPLLYYPTDYNVTPMTPRQFRRFRKNSGNSGKDSGQCCVTQIQFCIASCTPSLILMSTYDRLHSCMLFTHDFHYWKVVDHNHMWHGNVWFLK